MSKHRLIKKYPNRRLYDTELSAYITLDDLKQYVIDFIPIKIIDNNTEEDVTRACLIQVILELETGVPLFSQETLEQMIRVHGNPMQTVVKNFLEKSLHVFIEQQKNFQNLTEETPKEDYFASLTKLTAKNMALWQELWKNPSATDETSPPNNSKI